MKKYNFYLFLIFFKIIICEPSCKQGVNLCARCNPITKLCDKCEKDIYAIDEKGGCTYAKKCRFGENHCYSCSEEGNLCIICEEDYFPDENGGCSYTDNCVISEQGVCLECKKNFILIGIESNFNNEIKICKSLDSDDLKNCEDINMNNGKCISCKKGYYLNSGDKKCIESNNCEKSSFGICQKCNQGFYFDKIDNNCKNQTDIFNNCKESLDGKTCSICENDFYLTEDKKCISTNYCSKSDNLGICRKCIDNYYITNFEKSCVPEKFCFSGDRDFGICNICQGNYYLDLKDGKCKSNLENNEYKYCAEIDENRICKKCDYEYYLGEDNKCCNSKFCAESENQVCKKCINNYHLGLDNLCIDIEKCIYSNYLSGQCTECEDNYYYNKDIKKCILEEGNFKNCKSGEREFCLECKNDFYLNQTDHLCYSNKDKNAFYKCSLTDEFGKECIACIENYYLGEIDNKCTAFEGCQISENENRCKQCNDIYYCLDLKTGKCEINDEIISEDKKFYFRCNKTNEEGNACKSCLFDYNLNQKGLCINDDNCEEKKEGICKKCKDDGNNNYCLNKDFGCIDIYEGKGCLECNNNLNLDSCTKCKDGYLLDDDGRCIEKEI